MAKNDSQRLKDEFKQLRHENPDLAKLMVWLYHHVYNEYGKNVTMTMIFRTQAEQDGIYKGVKRGKREYDKKPWKSPHQFWHAVDIRSRHPLVRQNKGKLEVVEDDNGKIRRDVNLQDSFTDKQIKEIENALNEKFNRTNYYRWTAKCHKVGKGAFHFHIQYVRA